MLRRFSAEKVYGIKAFLLVLAIVLAASAAGFPGAVMAQEGGVLPLKWVPVDKPGFKGEIVLFRSEINRIATSKGVVYALDSVNGWLHRSDNGGVTFDNMTQPLVDAGAQLPAREIAVAPDMSQYVAVSDDNSEVWWSYDSGATWTSTNLRAYVTPPVSGDIRCLAISNSYTDGVTGSFHDLAVGTADWVDTTSNGQLWTLTVGTSFSGGWQYRGLTIAGSPGAEVSSIAFAPQYTSDRTILAVASTGLDGLPTDQRTWLCIGQGSGTSPVTWNIPLLIIATDPTITLISISSSIALPSDYNYSAVDITKRKLLVNYSRVLDTGNNDIYRFDDTTLQPLLALGRADSGISSISYYGTISTGRLLYGAIGAVDFSVPVWMLENPLASDRSVNQPLPAKQPPSGRGNAQVAWNSKGTIAFCGTGQIPGIALDESAFSQSSDNGLTWTQTSLINTIIRMCDIAPAPDSKSMFMATFSNGFIPEAIWRCAGEPLGTYWARMYSMRTFSDMVLLRMSPGYNTDYTIYAVEAESDNRTLLSGLANNTQLAVSTNQGNLWRKRYIPGPVIDMIAAGKDTLYLALPGGVVRKSTDGGLTWGNKVPTGLTDINMLALAGNGDLFAGSMDSKVAYSTDGGASFTAIVDPVSLIESNVQVAADAGYSRNHVIYASADCYMPRVTDNASPTMGVWRRTIGESTGWEQLDEIITAAQPLQRVSGLAAGPEGTLYALRADRPRPGNLFVPADNYTGTGGMNRTLNPTEAFVINIEWDIVDRTLSDSRIAFDPGPLPFANSPPWLKLSGNAGENDLWAIDTANVGANVGANDDTAQIYRFRDNLCKVGPWTSGPSEVGSDPVSGRNQQVDFRWEQLSLTDRYELQIAKDPAFDIRIDPTISNSNNISAVTGAIRIGTDPYNVLSPAVWLPPSSLPEARANYYWRVRCYRAATWEYIRSPWSGTDSFAVRPGFPVTVPYPGPQLLAPADCNGCPCGAPISFYWSPDKAATRYKFELADNAGMSRPLVSADISGPAYYYIGNLPCERNYFWHVRALEPVPGDWSATFSFELQSARATPAPAGIRETVPLWAFLVMAAGMLAILAQLVILLRRLDIL